MRKRLTESVIDANICERDNNKRKYVIWKIIYLSIYQLLGC